ncbi:MAG: heavy metal translocating P-type ATPase, partial [Treponema sp.]|nr:heavy metal translocating P-type ATPase [Treponema sp.]
MEDALKREYILHNLCCPKCAAKIEKHIGALEGVNRALIDFSVQKLTIEMRDSGLWDDITARAGGIIKKLEPSVELQDSVFSPEEVKDAGGRGSPPRVAKWLRYGSLILGMVLFAAGMAINRPLFVTAAPLLRFAVFLASYLLTGGGVLVKAARNIARGEIFDENFLMSLATIGAFAIGEYPEGAAVMIFYQIGEAFQNYAVGRSRKSISALMNIRPDYANLKTAAGLKRVSPETVRIGDLIVVKPGEKIPL